MKRKAVLASAFAMMGVVWACDGPRIMHPTPSTKAIVCEDPTTGCDDRTGGGDPGTGGGTSPTGQTIVQSRGFYLASDGVYEWDGNPPVGDLDPATLQFKTSFAEAPNGVLGGKVYAEVYLTGDQSKMKITYSALDDGGNYLYFNSEKEHDWKWCDDIGFGRCTNAVDYESQDLHLEAYPCGVTVIMGGTASARKALPFGIGLGSRLLRVISIKAPSTWGDASIPLPAKTSPPAPACPHSPDGAGGERPSPPPEGYSTPAPNSGPTVCTYTFEWEVTFTEYAGTYARVVSEEWICM